MIDSLNKLNSQWIAIVVALLGIGCFGLATVLHGTVQEAVISSGGTLIGGTLTLLLHQKPTESGNGTSQPNPTLPGQPGTKG